MQKIILGILFSFICFSCQKQQETKVVVAETPVDSALVLALVPTMESLPFYYADESGLFQKAGVPVVLQTFGSQMDADSAIWGTTAVGGVSDLFRVGYHAHRNQCGVVVSMLAGSWKWLGNGVRGFSRLVDLKGKTTAVSRFAMSDYWSAQLLKENGMEYEAVKRPQVNDYRLRFSMLHADQVNAAILPEPYATEALLKGNHLLAVCGQASDGMGCLVFRSDFLQDSLHTQQVKKIVRVYNQAVEELNRGGKEKCRKLLVDVYGLTDQVVDSLEIPQYPSAWVPDHTHFEKVADFLNVQKISVHPELFRKLSDVQYLSE